MNIPYLFCTFGRTSPYSLEQFLLRWYHMQEIDFTTYQKHSCVKFPHIWSVIDANSWRNTTCHISNRRFDDVIDSVYLRSRWCFYEWLDCHNEFQAWSKLLLHILLPLACRHVLAKFHLQIQQPGIFGKGCVICTIKTRATKNDKWTFESAKPP